MQKPLHPRDDVDRLHVPSKEGGRGLTSIEDSVDASIQRLEDYIEKRGGRLITATRKNIVNTRINRTKIPRKQKWEEKQFYGRLKRLTIDISHKKTWTLQRKGNLKRETESLLIASQNNAIKTNHVKARIDKTQQNSKYRLCGDRDETINHIISECSKLAQKEYKIWLGGQSDSLGIVQEIELWPYEQMVYAQPKICPGEWDPQTLLGFWDTNWSPNFGQTTRPYNNQQKREFAEFSTLLPRLTTE